jgi:hypothetical protein
MTIRKGEEWGHQAIVPKSFVVAEDDFDAASQPPGVPFALRRGDMFAALGNPRIPTVDGDCMLVPIDSLVCRVTYTNGSEEEVRAFSHISVGSWWRRRHIIISNSGFISGANIAPRSHPNDGEFDVVTLSEGMPFQQRFIAKRKAKTGTHVPHPDISIRRHTEYKILRKTPQERLSIDGVAVSNWRDLCINIEPDYWVIII